MQHSWPRLFRIIVLLVLALGLMAFDSCNDDPLLDSRAESGGGGCAGSHCSPPIVPDTTANPASF